MQTDRQEGRSRGETFATWLTRAAIVLFFLNGAAFFLRATVWIVKWVLG